MELFCPNQTHAELSKSSLVLLAAGQRRLLVSRSDEDRDRKIAQLVMEESPSEPHIGHEFGMLIHAMNGHCRLNQVGQHACGRTFFLRKVPTGPHSCAPLLKRHVMEETALYEQRAEQAMERVAQDREEQGQEQAA